MSKWRCLSCLGVWTSPQHGIIYFHVCPSGTENGANWNPRSGTDPTPISVGEGKEEIE